MPKPAKKTAKNGSRRKAAEPPKPIVSEELKDTIYSIDPLQLWGYMYHFCHENEPLRKALAVGLLVHAKDVVRYHADSDSEDDENSENESSEGEYEGDSDIGSDEDREQIKKPKPIALAEDKMTPRYTQCLNCKPEFDISDNCRGYCTWHLGIKTYNSS